MTVEVSEAVQAAEFKSLAVKVESAVAEIKLKGPGKGNAMGPDFWSEFPQAIKIVDSDPAVRAVIVTGEGKDFSFGLDLPAMMPHLAARGKFLGDERRKFLDLALKLQHCFSAIEASDKPFIAAVDGWCIGAGLDLIAACDIRLCSSEAKFSLREVKVAIVADLGSLQRLPHIIGQGYTRELAFTGKNIDAKRAREIGLVNDVYESAHVLQQSAEALAAEIAENAPLVVQGTKHVLNASRDSSVADGLKNVALWNSAFLHSPDLEEAVRAFMERRPPKY
ncbi:MAG TPA: crotonase/enoyl-CoA hydratase family protein [Oculatellaceae cyanobacterium]